MRLLLIIGPPAVGKMTVGRAVAGSSAFRLFHNHHTIEMLLDVFDYGTGWPRRSRNATSTGPTPTSSSSRPSTG